MITIRLKKATKVIKKARSWSAPRWQRRAADFGTPSSAIVHVLNLMFCLIALDFSTGEIQAANFSVKPNIEILPAKGNMRGIRATLVTRELTPEEAWSVITDYNHFSDFMPLTQSSEVTKEIKNSEGKTSWVLTTLKVAFTKISYVLRIDHHESQAMRKSSWIKESGDLKELEGSWLITASTEGTSLIYTSYLDAGKAIPGWIQDLLTKNSVPDLFEAIIARGKKHSTDSMRVRKQE